jgi:hypothetical protein
LSAEVTPSKVAVQTVAVKASDEVLVAQPESTSSFAKLFYGLILGLLGYTVVVKRRPLIDIALNMFELVRSKLVKK